MLMMELLPLMGARLQDVVLARKHHRVGVTCQQLRVGASRIRVDCKPACRLLMPDQKQHMPRGRVPAVCGFVALVEFARWAVGAAPLACLEATSLAQLDMFTELTDVPIALVDVLVLLGTDAEAVGKQPGHLPKLKKQGFERDTSQLNGARATTEIGCELGCAKQTIPMHSSKQTMSCNKTCANNTNILKLTVLCESDTPVGA